MFRKCFAACLMSLCLGFGVTQLLADSYPALCKVQLCCPNTYNGYTFSLAVAESPGLVGCYYSTGSGYLYTQRFCDTSPCFED